MNNVTDKQYHKMIEMKIPSLVLRMAIPACICMIITVVYNTADTYFVSKIDKSASAAVGAVYALMSIIQAVGYGLGMGASSLISRLLGKNNEGDHHKAEVYAVSAFVAALLMGLLVLVLGSIFFNPMLKMLGCSDTMMPYARPYAKYILLSAPIFCSSFVVNNILRSQGKVFFSMLGTGIGGIINMILDPILIFNLNLGVAGASIATAISQVVSFLILISFFVFKKSIIVLKIKNISKNFKDYLQIITTGLPTVFRQGMGSIAAILLSHQAVKYGSDAAMSAITIANKVYILTRNLVLGVGQGFQPVAGYNFGAKKYKRTWKAFLFTCLIGTIICTSIGILSYIYSPTIMIWFTHDASVLVIGIKTIKIASIVMPLMGFSTYVNQMYQCLGFKVGATFLASCRQGIFYIPIVLLLPLFINLLGVEMAQPLSDLLTFIVSIPFLIYFYHKHLKSN